VRILFVSPHFPPDISALARRVHELGKQWSAAGHEVHVLCGLPGHPTGELPARYRGRLYFHERVDGIDVHRTWTYVTPNARIVRRSIAFASYAASALTVGQLQLPQPDVIVASSPQFFAAVAGVVMGWVRQVPVVVEIRDLWPQSVWEVGAISRNHPAIAFLEHLEHLVYRTADRIVVVAEPFRDHILACAPERSRADIEVITNGADLRRFHPAVEGEGMRAELGISSQEPVALYAGTHGMAHGLETVVDAARLLPNVSFVFVGEGARKEAVRDHAEGLQNVRFHAPIDGDRMPALYAAADVCLVPLRDLDVFQTVIPSKLFEIWGLAKPVVLGVRGEAARIVAEAGGGVVVRPEDPRALATAIDSLVTDPDRAAALGRAGRRRVEQRYDRSKLAQRYLDLLAEVAGAT